MKVYEYVITHTPKDKEVRAAIIKNTTTVAAATEQEAVMKAAREIPTDYENKLDEVDIHVRCF